MKLLRILLVLCLFGLTVQAEDGGQKGSYSTSTHRMTPLDIFLNANQLPEKAGPAELRLTVICHPGGLEPSEEINLTVSVKTINGLVFHGPESWSAPELPDSIYSTVLSVDIPPDDTSGIDVIVGGCGRYIRHTVNYFVNTGPRLEYWQGYPNPGSYSQPEPPDTTTYRIRLDLRDPEYLQFFKQYEEQLGSIEPTADSGFYIYRTTWEGVRDLLIEGFKLEPVDSIPDMPTLPPRPTPTRKHDSTSKPRSPSSPQGNQTGSSSSTSVWLQMSDGSSVPGGLPSDQQLTFHVGLNNNTANNMQGITNAFRVYSPDGATWTTTVGIGNTAPTT